VGPDVEANCKVTAFPPYVDTPRCTLYYMLRHVSICVDLRLHLATYVYTVMSVYVRLRLATRCRQRMSTCVDTVDACRHTSSISYCRSGCHFPILLDRSAHDHPLTVLSASPKFSSSGFSHICLHRSECVDIGLCRSTYVDRRRPTSTNVDQLCLQDIDTGRQTGLPTLRLRG
jgi:hypothetical protein